MSDFHPEMLGKFRYGYKEGSFFIIEPKIDGQKKQAVICFGCKKVICRTALKDEHRRSCKNKDAHKEACKSMLETASTTQEAEPQATPLATPADFTDPEGKGRPLAVVIRDFQRTIERLNSVIECDKQTVEEAETKSAKADMFLDGLNYTIKYMKGEQREVYEAFLPNFQEEYPDILEFVKL